MKTEFTCVDCANDIFAITAQMEEQMYLVLGTESAMLIDTGTGVGSLKSYVNGITSLPLIVINTHGHIDHASGNSEFDRVYMNFADLDIYEEMCTIEYRIQNIRKIYGRPIPEFEAALIPFKNNCIDIVDRKVFDLGNRRLRIITTPGHTYGSICILDEMTGILFTGDTVTASDTWLYMDHSAPMKTYAESLKKLLNIKQEIRQLNPGHIPIAVTPELIGEKLACVKDIYEHGKTGVMFETFAGKGLRYASNGTAIVYNPNNIKTDSDKERST